MAKTKICVRRDSVTHMYMYTTLIKPVCVCEVYVCVCVCV